MKNLYLAIGVIALSVASCAGEPEVETLTDAEMTEVRETETENTALEEAKISLKEAEDELDEAVNELDNL